MIFKLDNKQVDVLDVEYCDNSASITGAYFMETGEDLTSDEMYELDGIYQDRLMEKYYSEAADKAEYYMDLER